ncbi:MAG TPA: hypothetical protein VF162_16885 [Streptosporangiaceae bacterium]
MPDMSDRGPDEPGEEQQARITRRDTDQDRTLIAMQQLEAALAAAAPRREQAWRGEVLRTLTVLGDAAREEADNAAQPDSLLSDIARTQPWLRNRARGLRIHYRQLRDTIGALQDELSKADDETVDFTDIRQRLAWVLAGLRHQRARESDLIYEAYYDAVRSDIEEGADVLHASLRQRRADSTSQVAAQHEVVSRSQGDDAVMRTGGSSDHDSPEGTGPSVRDDSPRWDPH